MSLDPEVWAEIARLWIEGSEPVGRIAARFGISHQRIVGEARRQGWPARGADAMPPGTEAKPAEDTVLKETDRRKPKARPAEAAIPSGCGGAGTSRKRNRTAVRRAMVERLFDAMDRKLSALEARIAAEGDVTPADSERTTRALNTLVRSLEKLADYENKIGKGKGRSDGRPRTAVADPERRRSELAHRIERLLDRR